MSKIIIAPKRPRLYGFDYASGGYYSVTVITNFRECTLSNVIDSKIILLDLGQVVERQLLNLPQYFPNISIDSYVIMPNHVHALLRFEDDFKTANLSQVVNQLKSKTTVQYNKLLNKQKVVWQYSYYDVIIRSEKQLFSVRQYIKNNPIKWELDELNPAAA
jgi:REP element-mobilizing transposase RayT